MSGTIPLSMTQQFDVYGQPLAGGSLYIMQAGTVAVPQNPYQDAALSIVMPNPIILDAAGRVPQFFLADGYVKIRLTDINGIVQLASDGILVIGPSAGGGGGGGTIDPTTILQTGDIKTRYDTAVITGFVRCNGKTLGPSTSGATELADPSAQALFNYLWNKDSSLVVLPSRGANSAADWTAGNKTIAIPDWRGYGLTGLDDMGNSAANRFQGYFTGPTTLGQAGGSPTVTLVPVHLPPYTPSGTIVNGAITITPNDAIHGTGAIVQSGGGGGGVTGVTPSTIGATQATSTFAGNAQGGTSTPFPTISPTKLLTIYMKL